LKNSLILELKRLLKNFTIGEVLIIEARYDEQYKALKFLHKNLREKKYFCSLALLNALVSYQLTGTGEDYWWEFAKYFSEIKWISNPVNAIVKFLNQSKYNRRFLRTKIMRLRKIEKTIQVIINKQDYYISNILALRDLIAGSLKADIKAKTIVFAIKMFNYACRISSRKNYILPYEISIPVDIRIKALSRKLGVNRNLNEFWERLALDVQIPPLHLDSLLWISIGMIRRKKNPQNKKLRELINFLKPIV